MARNKIITFWKYIKPLWEGPDNRISLRSTAAIALIVDFVINVHNSSYMVVKVFDLIKRDKTIDSALVASMSGNLAQIAMILGIEAALIAAMLALKTYQPNKDMLVPMVSDSPAINQPKDEPLKT